MSEAMTEPKGSNISEPITIDDFQNSYLSLFYVTLFHPVQAFTSISRMPEWNSRLLFFSIISVILVSTIAPLVHMATLGGNPAQLVWAMPLSAVGGLMIWGLMGLLIGLLAYAFCGKARVAVFLTLSGLATLPWVLMGPVSMLNVGLGPVGGLCFMLLALGIWLWSVILFALALAETYGMTPDRVLIILAAPFAMSLVLLSWLFGFIENIRQWTFHL